MKNNLSLLSRFRKVLFGGLNIYILSYCNLVSNTLAILRLMIVGVILLFAGITLGWSQSKEGLKNEVLKIVYIHAGAKLSIYDNEELNYEDFNRQGQLEENLGGWWLANSFDPSWVLKQKRALVSTDILDRSKVYDQTYVNLDGSPIQFDSDYF